jgi:hypothetical protein
MGGEKFHKIYDFPAGWVTSVSVSFEESSSAGAA